MKRCCLTALVILTLLAALTGCGSSPSDEFVTRSGTRFELGGKPFRFVGANLYDAAATDLYSCSPETRLSDGKLRKAMAYLHDKAGATVVRFWAYQTYTDSGKDFSGIDRVIDAARAEGLRVIPVLDDGPGDCTTGQPGESKASWQNDTWYTQGYKTPYGDAVLSYRDYVAAITHHYRNNPTIMAWMMMNEAETSTRNQGDQTALADFALDIGTLIKSEDPHHLVTLGTQGNGAPGTSGRDFAAIYSQPVLDFAEVHDWARYGSDEEALPGSIDGKLPAPDSPGCTALTAKIACSFAIAKQLGKPLIVGEAGVQAKNDADRERRAGLLQAKMNAAFAAGASGYLIWQANTLNTDGYALIIGQDDPLVEVLHREAVHLGS
jgi:aryl-phospho-beta-D-glucosidase BglC (GH1 family)